MSAMTLTTEIARAIEELEEAFPGRVTVVDRDASGVVILIDDVPLSARWTPTAGQLWFLVPYHYPDAPIYPYYVTGATPTGGVVPALQVASWRGMQVIQVSLRHNAWDSAHDNAVGSAHQAMAWLRTA